MGTQDILLYDSRAVPENCPKLVLPSPAVLYRERLKPLLAYKRDMFLDGSIIGGGGLISALTAHIRSGFSVFMTREAALSLRNDLEEVKAMGIQIVEKVPPGFSGEHLTLKEIDFTTLAALLSPWDIDLGQTEIAAIAVQDHGVSPPGMSNRYSRIQGMKEKLKGDPRPTHFAFLPEEIPSSHLRMQAAAKASLEQLNHAQPLLMDTSLAAICGCLADPEITRSLSQPILCVNLGNSHTMAALVQDAEVLGLLEHHTRALSPESLEENLRKFAEGDLTDEDVFRAGGHGAFYLKGPPGLSQSSLIAVTGPQRDIMRRTRLSHFYPAPFGDMMMTGPAGLILAAQEKRSCGSRSD